MLGFGPLHGADDGVGVAPQIADVVLQLGAGDAEGVGVLWGAGFHGLRRTVTALWLSRH